MKIHLLLIKQLNNLLKPLLFLAIIILGSNVNPVISQDWNEVIKTVASDRDSVDNFGRSVAISGDYAIVGAWAEDHDTSGGSFLSGAGSAYIFKNNAGTWSEVQKIVASDRWAFDYFGHSVAISGDYAIVGAFGEDEDTTGGNTLSDAGAAYIFKNNAGTWSEVQKIVASDRGTLDQFGWSVSISGDYAIISAHFEDEDTTGGNFLMFAGSAYIFKNNAGTWSEVQKIVASDRGALDEFGCSVSISGDVAIVGAIYEDEDTTGANRLGNAGSAYIFKNNAGSWSEVQKIVASDRWISDYFGYSVAISGSYAIVGAIGEAEDTTGANRLFDAGSAYIFKNNAGTWTEVQKLVPSDRAARDWFGFSVAISEETAIVGARDEDHDTTGGNALTDAGSAYIFKNDSGSWFEAQKIVASDRGANDLFGYSVAISGEITIVGAYYEDEGATGGNTLREAGSAYIFNYCPKTTGIDVQTACDSLIWIDSVTYTSSNNTATYILPNAAGCDSVITLNLTINNTKSSDTVTVCDNYTWNVNNTTYTTTGIYMDTLTNAAGCDSILTLDLKINKNTGIDVQTACDSLTWIDGITYTSNNNTATDTLINAAGCDSIVTLDLTINYSTARNDTVASCDRYIWNVNNMIYTTSGTYMDTLTNATGCDSVVMLILTIDSVSDLSTTTAGLTITANNANATYQWLDCGSNNAIITGEIGQTYTATSNGNYGVELIENGCVDTSACVQILTVGIIENSFGNVSFKINPNPTQGMLFIEIDQANQNTPLLIYNQVGQVVKEARLVNGRNKIDLIEQAKGVYLLRYGRISKKVILVD